jgi:hypothetical protein
VVIPAGIVATFLRDVFTALRQFYDDGWLGHSLAFRLEIIQSKTILRLPDHDLHKVPSVKTTEK